MSAQDSYDQNQRAAERVHDLTNDLGKRILDAAARDAQEAIKVALLINSGAAVAVLAFVGSLVSPKAGVPFLEMKAVTNSLYWFIAGIVAAGITAGCAYFCNSFYASSHFAKDKIWDHPYVTDNNKSKRAHRFAWWLNWVAIFLATAALLAFIGGVYVATNAFAALAGIVRP